MRESAGKPGVADADKPDRVLIGRALAGDARAAERCLLSWSRQRDAHSSSAAGYLWLIEVIALMTGALFGSGIAGALMAYSGARPVNVLPLLGLFALLPLALSVLFIIGAMTYRWWAGIPIIGELCSACSSMRMMLTERWLRRSMGAGQSVRRMDRVWRPIAGWLGARWTAAAGLGFQAGGMVVLIGAVTFSDLAFGWATTLDLSDERIRVWVEVSSGPWAWAWSEATVDLDLIERSRVYRLPGDTTGIEAGTRDEGMMLGGWWRYLLMAMLVYGLLPRLLIYGYAGWRLRSEARLAVLRLEDVRDVLLGMLEPTTRSDGDQGDSVTTSNGLARVDPHPAAVVWSGPEGRSINWQSWLAEGWSGASGSLSDPDLFDRLRGKGHGDVLVIVPGWEPPTGDRLDDLSILRERLDDRQQRIVVVLASPDSRSLADEEIADWRRSLSERGDLLTALAIAPREEPHDV